MSSQAAMEAELASVLADATFVRSPVLARLLAYLVKTTVEGKGHTLKSYSVAIEGLGRSPDIDPQVDTYARVQVARLRKALDGFYATAGAESPHRLLIDSGSYQVRLVPQPGSSFPKRAGSSTGRFRQASKIGLALAAAAAVAVLALLFLAVGAWRTGNAAELTVWRDNDFPSVTVAVEGDSDTASDADQTDLIRQELLMRIAKYPGVKVLYDKSARSDYVLNVKLYRADANLMANSFVVDSESGRVIWTGTDVIAPPPGTEQLGDDDFAGRTAFLVAHGTGIINASERRRNFEPDSPYGCWLRFTAQMLNSHVLDDPELAECSERWHHAQPDRPLASGLYAWILLDKSITAVSERGRQDLIDNAIRTLEQARALNPDHPLLPAVATRAYALAGDDEAMRAAAASAMQLNPHNLEVEGFIGTVITLRGDAAGEAIVDRAIARHPNPPPWYFVAKFTSAMMREDTAQAGLALRQLRQLNHSLPVLPIFTAAYEARTGQTAKANVSWDRAKSLVPVLRVNPDLFFNRTPLAPAVRERLKKWLAPVLA